MNSFVLKTVSCLVMALTLVSVRDVQAQEPFDLDVQNFRPSMDSRGFITVERSRVLGNLEPSIGFYTTYAKHTLRQKINGSEEMLVDSLVSGQLVLTLGLFDIVELGGYVPVTVIRGDPDGPGDLPILDGDGIGDAGFHLKIRALDGTRNLIGIALAASVSLPTGQTNTFISSGQSVIRPMVIVDWDLGSRVSMGINGGLTLRGTQSIAGAVTITDSETMTGMQVLRDTAITVGNELNYGFGMSVNAVRQRLDVVIEAFGAMPMISKASLAMPLEILFGLKLYLLGNSFLTVGATHGIMANYGDPSYRAFAGIVFEPTAGDRDQDGIDDETDDCPDRPEDKDGFEDSDGCPDTDNDMDRIPDIADQCPNDPEDRNGFEDEDGCPDGARDRDRDGISDSKDQCPDEPEDKDGFQDTDGCPDLDNDGDTIRDSVDQCPLKPEDFDEYQDEDGCPDEDNDSDGILDRNDRCPDQPENMNGIEDEDGCPENKVLLTRNKIEIMEKIYFETGKAVIKEESYNLLNEVASIMRTHIKIKKVEIQGHTDSRGSDSYNMELSQKRAAAVRAYLIGQGIQAERLDSRGYGETRPVDSSETETAWSKNRRVEFIIVRKPKAGTGSEE